VEEKESRKPDKRFHGVVWAEKNGKGKEGEMEPQRSTLGVPFL